MSEFPSPERYERLPMRRCGRSGVHLPLISLGLWHNFGDEADYDTARELVRYSFDQGIFHFDLANNYGPPPGSAEENFGKMLKKDFKGLRDELIISTKAGYRMWPGPYGEWGSRKYLLASLDQSLERMGIDYVDIFYSHRFDPNTPLEETMGALASAVHQGKAVYVGISSYSTDQSRHACRILREMGVPCLIHQPSSSILNQWVQKTGLLRAAEDEGFGMIAFSPLAQGQLTGRYLDGIPGDSRAASKGFLPKERVEQTLPTVRKLNEIAQNRGQSLAQMALAWLLKDQAMTSVLIGASRVAQIEENLGVAKNLCFTQGELQAIDEAVGSS